MLSSAANVEVDRVVRLYGGVNKAGLCLLGLAPMGFLEGINLRNLK